MIYDVVVLGTGGVGSAALCHLARRGLRALGLDRFPPAHNHGSSHGQTRIIRQAYFEHPDYTPLLQESYRLWSNLESQIGRKLYHQVGVLQIGPPGGVVVPGVLQAADEHGLRVEQLTAAEIHRRWSGINVPSELTGVLETNAGFLMVEECVQAHLELAQQAGAKLQWPVEVLGWDGDDPIRLRTSEGGVFTKKVVVTAGAWASELFADLGVEFKVLRKSLFWYATTTDQYSAQNEFPGFLFELPSGIFYGFPQIDSQGLKLAEHSGGMPIKDPANIDRNMQKDEQQKVEAFLREYLPNVGSKCTSHAACMYTMTPDGHFIVDRHPCCRNVVLAAGLSGHGFKFTSVLGKVLADLTIEGGTDLPIDFLSLQRFKQD